MEKMKADLKASVSEKYHSNDWYNTYTTTTTTTTTTTSV